MRIVGFVIVSQPPDQRTAVQPILFLYRCYCIEYNNHHEPVIDAGIIHTEEPTTRWLGFAWFLFSLYLAVFLYDLLSYTFSTMSSFKCSVKLWPSEIPLKSVKKATLSTPLKLCYYVIYCKMFSHWCLNQHRIKQQIFFLYDLRENKNIQLCYHR